MSYRLEIKIDCFKLPNLGKRKDPFPPSLNARLHWASRSKANAKWRKRIVIEVGNRKPEAPLERATLTLIRHSSSMPDFDNMVTSWKPLVDGLKDALVIVDDKPKNITAGYYWKKAPPGKGWLEIVVEAA